MIMSITQYLIIIHIVILNIISTACSASNCKTCTYSATTSPTTTCSACKPLYALKTSDKSCLACPTNCLTCIDNGSGVSQCTLCNTGTITTTGYKINSAGATGSNACLR